jgi:hypothetical protein
VHDCRYRSRDALLLSPGSSREAAALPALLLMPEGSAASVASWRRMKVCAAVLAACVVPVCGACGSDEPDEFVADEFVTCLTERGGAEVSRAQQLARLN